MGGVSVADACACVVTRGDVDMIPILESLADFGQVVVWDNSERDDLAVYGRYAAVQETDAEVIFTQDDDVIVSDPQAVLDVYSPDAVVANMPPEFRHSFYTEHCLVGFGSCFHRDAPERAFRRYYDTQEITIEWLDAVLKPPPSFFERTCDIVFTALTPRVLVDVPVKNLWWAENHTRMWRQENHVAERTRMLELVRQVRDA